MKVLDLFSGIGGFSVGLERAGFETVAFCEIEDYPRAVLRRHWPDVPIYGDIKQLTVEQLRADGIVPDVICGGYPCQPFSVAGRQRGQEDERHLWPEMLRLIRECKPRWVISENVSGHIKLGLDEVLASLEAEGYTTWSFIIPACAVNAPHKRDRVWIVAHADSDDGRHGSGSKSQEREARVEHGRGGKRQLIRQPDEDVADTHGARSQGRLSGRQKAQRESELGHVGRSSSTYRQPTEDWWAVEPAVGRVAHGIPRRVDRIRGLGNAVVPQIPEIIGQTILAFEAERVN